MIELDKSEMTGRVMDRLSGTEVGERIVITHNGEPVVALQRCRTAPRNGGIDMDELEEALRRHGIEPDPPEEVAAMKAAILDSSLSCRVLGLEEE